MNSSYRQRNFLIWLGGAGGILSLVLFIYLYQASPFLASVTNIVTSGMITIASILAALCSILVMRQYGSGTPPRAIWLYFMLAVTGWAVAESLWLYAYIAGGQEAASLGLADVLWVLSYLFFIVALFRQYSLIYRPRQHTSILYLVLAVSSVLIITHLFAAWLLNNNPEADRLETYVNTFYAVGDFALALGALVIAAAFRNGALGRPWLGLLVFAISDLLYAWLETSGLYAWSIDQGNILTTITDASYFAAYLVVAFGCYLQLILLRFGPRLKHDN